MKKLISILFLFAVIGAHAQDGSFQLKLNSKQIAKGSFTADVVVEVILYAKQLAAGGKLQMVIAHSGKEAAWKRVFILADAQGNEVKTMEKNMQNGTFNWNIPGFSSLMKKYKTLSLYTYSIPVDENQAALVRVRRFQLCTLQLK